ncbi:DUF418 domain-containing protein [Sphingomicrobium flavum]|uniref:DUF418 domain-containing protein n=1 Tax=Sphingomicrobium flavum TaxID=1229164 RepID=UPI0021AE24DD|nr:DUF418 domain-containing protein [Sphingomicrobium flavum]
MATTMRARIQTLDIIRGVAVMGILALNIYAMGGPNNMYLNPTAYGGADGINWFAWAFNFVFMESKFRSLFSIMFGASTLLVIERATAKSDSPALRHYARMFWLIVFGFLHYWFIWWGDILVLYGIIGLLVFLFRNVSVKWLIGWALALIGMGMAFALSINLLYMQAADPSLGAEDRVALEQQIEAVEEWTSADPKYIERDLETFRGSYGSIVQERFVDERWKPLGGVFFTGPETLGLFLIGMALFKSGFLTGEWSRQRYRKWALVTFAIAIPANLYLLWVQVESGYAPRTLFSVSIGYSTPFDILMAIGWAALVTMLAMGNLESPIAQRVGAAGRMAFTNYLMTSAVMTTIFYGYGLGLYGQFSRAGLYLFVFGMWALMLLWSKPWLDRFYYGPLEWIWRSLSRFSLQPMRKSA